MTITSRHNPLVARFRDAARGDADGVMLLDGAHLVADALSAGVAIHVAVVAAAARLSACGRSRTGEARTSSFMRAHVSSQEVAAR